MIIRINDVLYELEDNAQRVSLLWERGSSLPILLPFRGSCSHDTDWLAVTFMRDLCVPIHNVYLPLGPSGIGSEFVCCRSPDQFDQPRSNQSF